MSIIRQNPVPSDIDIAQAATIQPISEIAGRYGIGERYLEHYGVDKAKVSLEFLTDAAAPARRAKYIDVTAITPTPLGEGKTTTTVGLVQGFGAIGKKAVATIRQPSMGPTFGIKGGAAGGGYSQIVPMADFNLHLTGDIHAVSAAHNLCATALDARMYHENRWSDAYFEKLGLKKLNIDAFNVNWRRVMDMNDRVLRKILVGMGGLENGPLRETGFDISVASEVMAVLALSTSLADLRARLGRIVVALDRSGKAITAEDLKVAGAMTILMKDALKPNILQTLEEQLAFVHAGPFANIAHGNSSILADDMASRVADYVVTESGFGADMGFEKFMDIKCRASGMMPDAVVLVATVRALKMHGGGPKVTPGKPLAAAYTHEDLALLGKGLDNLRAHLAIIRKFGLPRRGCHQFLPRRHRGRARADRGSRPRSRRQRRRGHQELGARRRWRCRARARGRGGCRGAFEAGLPLPPGSVDQGQDRRPRARNLRRRPRGIFGRCRGGDRYLLRAGLRRSADLHGQDPVLAFARPGAQERPQGLRLPGVRPPPGRGRGLHLPAIGRDHHHARLTFAAGLHGHGHRHGDGAHHGPFLSAARGRAALGSRTASPTPPQLLPSPAAVVLPGLSASLQPPIAAIVRAKPWPRQTLTAPRRSAIMCGHDT